MIMQRKIIHILVNSNNLKEAEKIGKAVLKARLASCYSLEAKVKSAYYWPPKIGKIETNSGPQLILQTLPGYYEKIVNMVKKLHSDRVPFIGKIVIEDVTPEFYNWMKSELH